MPLTKIEFTCEGDDPCIYVVDQAGQTLAKVDWDDQVEEAITKVARGICQAAAGIEFVGFRSSLDGPG